MEEIWIIRKELNKKKRNNKNEKIKLETNEKGVYIMKDINIVTINYLIKKIL